MPDSSEQPVITFLDATTIGEVPNDDLLRKLGDYHTYPNTEATEVVDRLRGSTVAITNKVKIGRAEMEQLPDLKLICVAATGMNNIDLKAAKALGIQVENVAGYSTESVAQLTLTSLFTLAMDLIHLNTAVYDGTYSRSENFSYWRQPFYELGGARYGIVGMGTIGRRVAKLAEAYGAKVVYYSTSGKNTDQDYPSLSLNELLTTCEVISIHAPLNEATNNLLTYQELSRMKKSAYLLNMGRGGIVNEADLVRALDEERIAGAAVDVFTQEPLPADHPYLSVKRKNRLLLTPHVGWASVEARMTLVAGIAKNIRVFLGKS